MILYLKVDITHFSKVNDINYQPVEISKTIQVCRHVIASKQLMYDVSYPAALDPISDIEFYKEKLVEGVDKDYKSFIVAVTFGHLMRLMSTAQNYIFAYHCSKIEKEIANLNQNEKLKYFVEKRQVIKYDNTHPSPH